jgi:hypothetical protein
LARTYGSRKRVLVTGGAGFLGSHLVDRLLSDGHEVLCVDNLFSGTKRNIEHLHTNPRFEFLRHDVTFPLFVEVDEIYNLACPASPIQYQHDPGQTTKRRLSTCTSFWFRVGNVSSRLKKGATSCSLRHLCSVMTLIPRALQIAACDCPRRIISCAWPSATLISARLCRFMVVISLVAFDDYNHGPFPIIDAAAVENHIQ